MAEQAFMVLALVGIGLAAVAALAHRLRLPAALGYLLLGLAVSPLQRSAGLVPEEATRLASELCVAILLFFIGLELDLTRLQAILRKTAVLTLFNLAVPALAIAGLFRALGWSFSQAVALGIAVCLSSTIFGERLAASRQFPPMARERVLGTLLAEDVGAAGLLAIIVALSGGQQSSALSAAATVGTTLFFLVLLLAVALLVVPRVLDLAARTHSREVLVLLAVGFILLFGYLGLVAGSAELGAFVAGVAAAEAGSRFVVRNNVAPVRDLALASFLFLSALLVDVTTLTWGTLALGAAVAALSLVAKVGVNGIAASAAGLDLDKSLRVGIAMATIGEFSLILVASAESHGVAHPLMRDTVVAAMVLMLAASSLAMARLPHIESRLRPDLPDWARLPTWSPAFRQRGPVGAPRIRIGHVRTLAANAILLAAWWALVALYLAPYAERIVPRLPWAAPGIAIWVAVLGSLPFLYGLFRGYRLLVRDLVPPGDLDRPAMRARMRLIDAWVASGLAVLLLPILFLFPGSWPVVVGALLLAAAVGLLAWRQLHQLQNALEGTVERVLGRPVEDNQLHDMLRRYSLDVDIAAIGVSADSPLAGQTLRRARFSELTGCVVAVLRRGDQDMVNPSSDMVVRAGDVLLVVGDPRQLQRAEAFVVSHGEAIRMAAQSRAAKVQEIEVGEDCRWLGVPLAAVDLKHECGTLVLGARRTGEARPRPFRGDHVLQPGDRLIVLGTDLQLERTRRHLVRAPRADPPPGAARRA